MTTEVKQRPTDAERLEWCLRYCSVRTLGTCQDFDYLPLTLEIIDKAIEREKAKVASKAATEKILQVAFDYRYEIDKAMLTLKDERSIIGLLDELKATDWQPNAEGEE